VPCGACQPSVPCGDVPAEDERGGQRSGDDAGQERIRRRGLAPGEQRARQRGGQVRHGQQDAAEFLRRDRYLADGGAHAVIAFVNGEGGQPEFAGQALPRGGARVVASVAAGVPAAQVPHGFAQRRLLG
jgi:hypothetical protein